MEGFAITVDNVSPNRQLASSMKLVELTCELASHHSLDDILRCIARNVCEALECERATVFRFDPQRQELITRVTTKLEISEIRIPLDRGITGWVARERQPANIPDPRADDRWNGEVDRRTGFQTRNILAVPMVSPSNGHLLGVLQILNRFEGQFDDFDIQLLQAFASHAAAALERAELLESARQAQELKLSADLGRKIQTSFLPRVIPDVPGYEIATWWKPAEAVSGDYYDLIALPDGRVGVIVADVSGHGIGPSLLMASVRAMLHVLTRRRSDPENIVHLVSETIAPDLQDGRFITFLMAALDPQSHAVTYANAGQSPALHFDRQRRRFTHLQTTGLPLGLAAELGTARNAGFDMQPGDLLLLGTDGTIELRNDRDEMFGRPRLEALVHEHRREPAQTLIQTIRQHLEAFAPGSQPPDDMTLVILERKL